MSPPRPKIAVLADWWWPDTVGGAERSSRSAAMGLAQFADVSIYVPAAVDRVYTDGPLTVHAVRRPFARRVHSDSASRRALELLTAWLLPMIVWRLTRRIREFGPDVVFAANISRTGPWLIRWVRANGLPFVRSYHDLSDTCWRRSRLKASGSCGVICGECRIKVRLMRWATPPAAVSVSVSRFVHDDLVSAGLVTSEAGMVGYPLIGPEIGVPEQPSDGDNDIVLGYIGRIDPVKGVDSAIRTAAAYGRQSGRQVSMVVAGTGQSRYLGMLASLAAAESIDVDFVGQMDIDEFCERVDVVLIPSTWMEPFGRVAVEVGSRGRPALISPSGGLPEAAAVSGGRFATADFSDPEGAGRALALLVEGRPTGDGEPTTTACTIMPLERGVAVAVHRALDGAPAATATPAKGPSGTAAWSGVALALSQLVLMGTNLIFSLSLGYGGGLAVVGATASVVLVFQLTCGVLQRTLSEATLLATSHAGQRADRATCRWSVAAALLGGSVGAVAAVLLALLLPDAQPVLALAYAAGIPFAIALDTGRSADVATGSARLAVADASAWFLAQTALMVYFAATHSPIGVCVSWAIVNVVFFLASTAWPHRRPAFDGLVAWVRSRRSVMGPASLDAFLVGLTPVLAIQLTAFVASASTLGAIRILQQVFSPLAFLSISLRRVFIYRQRADVRVTAGRDLRVGLLSMALMAVGAALIGAALTVGRGLLPELAFIPVGVALVAAGLEKAALGFSFGASLSTFVRGRFDVLLRARYLMVVLTLLLAPAMTMAWDATGYLIGSSVAIVVYSLVVLVPPRTRG